jgi:hypothetical protein
MTEVTADLKNSAYQFPQAPMSFHLLGGYTG